MPWKHPELRKGEVWLSNFYEGEELEEGDDLSEFCDIAWKTKRRGCRAYDINGQRLYDGHFPVFVQAEELKKAGINIS